jgi:hypothetical protein
VGLEQLMGASSLVQSFPATPDRPVPPLWSERLGEPFATRLWRSQRRVWWQIWANQSETAPFLVIEARPQEAAAPTVPPQALRVGDLFVVGENTTARRQLAASLRPLQRRSRGGLSLRCLQRLQAGQAVYWNGAGLGGITGQVAPLLEPFQVGCLSLALEDRALRWQGEAAAAIDRGTAAVGRDGRTNGPQVDPGAGSLLAVPALGERLPLGPDQLLEIEGASLDLLLRGLIDRPMIRDPLAGRYGLEGIRLEQARRTPFRLRLRPQGSGPFRAGLELQLLVGSAQSSWIQILDRISTSLRAQGLENGPARASGRGEPAAAALSQPPSPGSSAGAAGEAGSSIARPGPEPGVSAVAEGVSASPGGAAGASGGGTTPARPAAGSSAASSPAGSTAAGPGTITAWRRADGVTVGGWRWVNDPGRPSQLLLFLGPAPQMALPIPVSGSFRPGHGQLWMRLRPEAMAALELLPQEMPALLQRSSQLWIEAEPLQSGAAPERISRLSGRLQLKR